MKKSSMQTVIKAYIKAIKILIIRKKIKLINKLKLKKLFCVPHYIILQSSKYASSEVVK